jgi:sugar O-acyltransferase (sialic acid O-acetyltransferase NeuD family)
MLTEILLIGAGGHGKVVIEAIKQIMSDCVVTVADQDEAKVDSYITKESQIVFLDGWSNLPRHYHVTIGNNKLRYKCSSLAKEQGKDIFTIVHPRSYVSPSASIGKGVFVAANAIVSSEAVVKEGGIINHGAIVDHECVIGEYSHIAPNATLGGGVTVGRGCLIGSGASVLPLVKIGDNVVIGAGAVITKDVNDNQKIVGVPGRDVNIK